MLLRVNGYSKCMAITRGRDWPENMLMEVRRNIHLDSIQEAQILNHFKPRKRVEVLVPQGMINSNGSRSGYLKVRLGQTGQGFGTPRHV